MSKQITRQRPKPSKPGEPADAPTTDQSIAKKWFTEES